ncbi:hypothetical protein FACS1894124_0490 [Spirochaetia bacterium]|nr:hypothetical protein FACS1894124_0490 [Spirochaetia bacterium]
MSVKKIITVAVLVLCTAGVMFAAAGDGTRRLGIFIGSNNGGRGRVMLRYAVSDARSVARVFSEMGGIAPEDTILLVEPDTAGINSRIDAVADQVTRSAQTYKRTEVVFYYSGHSDEEGLLLNRERYAYKDLRDRINSIPSDMRIVILDSCSSGSFTRAKGGLKTQPFLIDSSLSAAGYAFLTSSSASEASQESDSIESSYFTHSLVAGLRGAADTIGDGRVTLNEAYRFAYTQTLAQTETSVYGAQHPSYDMQVSGTGDVVLTDIKETSASLVLDADISGRLSIRDSSEYLIAEITKTAGRPMELGLESGLYRITLQRGDSFFRVGIQLEKDKHTPLTQKDFTPIDAVQARARGDGDDRDAVGASHAPFSIQLVPSLAIPLGKAADSNNVLIGIIGAAGKDLRGAGAGYIWVDNSGTVEGIHAAGIFSGIGRDLQGIQMAGIVGTVGGDVNGIQMMGIFSKTAGDVNGAQMSGIFSKTAGNVNGAQMSGIFNRSGGDINGTQAAGFFNYAGGNFRGVQMGLINIVHGDGGDGTGVQVGLINVSNNEKVLPIGLLNVVKNGLLHPAIYYDDMEFINLSFRSGSKHFYTIMSVGTQSFSFGTVNGQELSSGNSGDLLVYRTGIGTELPLGRHVFLDLDVSSGSIINFNTLREHKNASEREEYPGLTADSFNDSSAFVAQVRLTAGFKFFKHLGLFGGISYDYLYRYNNQTSPDVNRSIGDFVYGASDGRTIHKAGFFAGVQF